MTKRLVAIAAAVVVVGLGANTASAANTVTAAGPQPNGGVIRNLGG